MLASALHAGTPFASVFHTWFAWPEPLATYPSEEALFAFQVLVSVLVSGGTCQVPSHLR